MEEFGNFEKFSREKWSELYKEGLPPLSIEELEDIKSLNDKISLEDVQEIYVPLIHLIRVYHKAQESITLSKGLFLRQLLPTPPFIIGVSGSVAVGKSTTARLLQILLQRTFKRLKVELITTDGFLYPNETLIEQGILNRKGFPESYDMETLICYLTEVKNGKELVESPVYSHEVYNVVEGVTQETNHPEILIVEGINVLQLPEDRRIFISDFFDFSIYVDAEEENIKKWYLERFEKLLDSAFQDPTNFYYSFAQMNREDALLEAEKVWKSVNQVNLEKNILPTRSRANVVLHKSSEHKLDKIFLKKY
ncbi:MAG: type I pantothenate kinase [Streptococcaceae bacterium]|jgi:type I pantothenate kinase|nr:type I pantothenate kinase [Streptococcaceae bacterium]